MTTTLVGISQCPGCASKNLVPVIADFETNFFCEDCACCWHLVGEDTRLVDPEHCPGCVMGSGTCFARLASATRPVGNARGGRLPATLGSTHDPWEDVAAELLGSAREASLGWFPLAEA